MVNTQMYNDPDFETYLQTLLPVIMPSQEFVAKLQNRLTDSPAILLERRTNRKALLVILFGLMGGLIGLYLFRHYGRNNS